MGFVMAGIHVTIAALDTYYHGNPVPVIANLLARADEVEKRKGYFFFFFLFLHFVHTRINLRWTCSSFFVFFF